MKKTMQFFFWLLAAIVSIILMCTVGVYSDIFYDTNNNYSEGGNDNVSSLSDSSSQPISD